MKRLILGSEVIHGAFSASADLIKSNGCYLSYEMDFAFQDNSSLGLQFYADTSFYRIPAFIDLGFDFVYQGTTLDKFELHSEGYTRAYSDKTVENVSLMPFRYETNYSMLNDYNN
ncbi:hypothetical protein OPS25_13900 [Alteromonas ponticola]|uniref:Uncharacterized protein n=1 Tax=Alteromonas aquimaris TaxID=2998417 RepID=A0ABT3P9Y7_9ALTE|nr:hypothetical protein [Alteromonas aquimaris]MCW8109598.1 hypothetical protein [Alteromonas aquimaris]